MSPRVTSDPVRLVLDRLAAMGKVVKNIDGQSIAQCPGHDDNSPSLAVREGDEGVLLQCHAGCDTRDVVSALGLNMRDLFSSKQGGPPTLAAPRSRPAGTALSVAQRLPSVGDGILAQEGGPPTRPTRPPSATPGDRVGTVAQGSGTSKDPPGSAPTPLIQGGRSDRSSRPGQQREGADILPLRAAPSSSLAWVADYIYHDAAGTPAFKVTRYAKLSEAGIPVGKSFHQFRRDPSGAGWTAGLNGAKPPLYHLPEVLAAVREGTPVLIVEGEKDADRAIEAGAVATTSAGGAGKWRPEHTAALTGASVVVVADDDRAGHAHATTVYEALSGVAKAVQVFLPAAGCKDLSEHLDAGNELFALRPFELAEPAGGDEAEAQVDRLQALLLDSAALDSIQDPEWLIENILVKDSPAWLQGKPGHGKSFVALDWAGCVGAGLEWCGRKVAPGPVLYLIAEGASGVKLRTRAWESKRERYMENVMFLPLAIQVTSREWAVFVALVRRLQPAMVVLDTQARITVGMEENAAKDMGEFVAAVEHLRDASAATILVVHHEGRAGENMRGSTALEGAATTVVRVAKELRMVTVSCPKQKDAAEFEPLELALEPHGMSAIITPMGVTSGSSIVDSAEARRLWEQWWECFGSDFMSVSVAQATLKVPSTSFYRAKKTLVRAGVMVDDGAPKRPLYRLLRGVVDVDAPNDSQEAPNDL